MGGAVCQSVYYYIFKENMYMPNSGDSCRLEQLLSTFQISIIQKRANPHYESWYTFEDGLNPEKALQKSNLKENGWGEERWKGVVKAAPSRVQRSISHPLGGQGVGLTKSKLKKVESLFIDYRERGKSKSESKEDRKSGERVRAVQKQTAAINSGWQWQGVIEEDCSRKKRRH